MNAILTRLSGRPEGLRYIRQRKPDLRPYCTLAVIDALAFSVNVQLFVLFPPLEHAPDQTTSRPFASLRVIDAPVENDTDPLLPTVTLMPAGVDVMRSPLRPLAVTVNVAVPDDGGGGAEP